MNMHAPTRSQLNRVCRWILPIIAAFAMAGCNILTPVVYAVQGPGKIKKATTLDPELKYVIFVDDPSNKVASRRLRSTIVDTAQQALLQQGVTQNMIDGRSAFAVVSKERYGKPMSIIEIGQSVGADIVIYALLTEFSLGAEVGTYSPTAMLQVKMLDVRSEEKIWPADGRGTFPLRVNMPQKPGLAPSTTSEIYKAQEELATRTGMALAQMFYDVEVPFSVRRNR